MASEFGTVRDYERALTFALRNATLNQKRILGAHLAAPGQTMSAQQLAKVVGFKTFGGTNAQYGTFARAVAKRLGLRRKPKGFWLNVLAEWGAQEPITGHTRFVLRPEVVTALKNPRVSLSPADGPRLWILIGGNDKFNGDYSLIGRLAGNGGTRRWGGRTLAKAQPGDQILLYVGRPHSQLIARARFVGPPQKGGPYGYRAPISGVEMLSPALSLHALKKQFRKWGWLMQPRSSTLVPDWVAGRLRRLATVPGEGPATRNGHFAVLDRIEVVAAMDTRRRRNRHRRPRPEVVAAATAGAEHSHVAVAPLGEECLDGLIRAVGIAHNHFVPFRNDAVQALAQSVVQSRERPRAGDEYFDWGHDAFKSSSSRWSCGSGIPIA